MKVGPSIQMVVFGMGDELWFLSSINLREEILREFHCSCFVVHPAGMKIYRDLCCQYYWSGTKRNFCSTIFHVLAGQG